MLSLGEYVAGAACLVAVGGALGYAAVRIRAWLVPAWSGAPARLAEAIVAIALLVWVGQLLGTVGLLERGWVVVAALAVAAAARALTSRATPPAQGAAPPAPPVAPLELLVTVGVSALLFAHWGYETQQSLNNGITNFDSLWYHMPFATEFAQEGSATGLHRTDPLFLNWFYPQSSELVHGIGIVLTERDVLSLFLNLGWLGLALLSAWSVGRPYGRGPHAVCAAAILLEAHTLVVREPGAAKNDIVGTALFLAAAALLVNWHAARREGSAPATTDAGALALGGLAAGLAAGSKLTVLAPVAGLTVAAVALAAPGERRRAAAIWFAPLLAGGGFWYARNLLAAGNPLPWIRDLGPVTLPGPERLREARPDFPVVHYITDTDVWTSYFTPGLHEAFGDLWPLVLLAAIAGVVLALARGPDRAVRALGAVALFATIAYLFTPLSAAGEEGMPVAFAINIRFAIPALLLGAVLLSVAIPLRGSTARWALLAALIVVMAITDRSDQVLRAPERAAGAAIATLFVLAPAALLAARRRLPRRTVVAGALALPAIALAAGYPVGCSYLDDRFARFDPSTHMDSAYRFAAGLRDTRIGLAGTTSAFYAYGLYGKELSNEVRYLGREGKKGAFSAIPTCAGFRRAVNEFAPRYLVTAPFLNFEHTSRPIRSPEAGWIRTDPAVRAVSRDGPVAVWRVRGRLDPGACARLSVDTTFVPGPR